MHYPVLIRRGADEPPRRLVNGERTVRSGGVAPGEQIVSQADQVGREVVMETGYGWLEPFTPLGFPSRAVQVLERS